MINDDEPLYDLVQFRCREGKKTMACNVIAHKTTVFGFFWTSYCYCNVWKSVLQEKAVYQNEHWNYVLSVHWRGTEERIFFPLYCSDTTGWKRACSQPCWNLTADLFSWELIHTGAEAVVRRVDIHVLTTYRICTYASILQLLLFSFPSEPSG